MGYLFKSLSPFKLSSGHTTSETSSRQTYGRCHCPERPEVSLVGVSAVVGPGLSLNGSQTEPRPHDSGISIQTGLLATVGSDTGRMSAWKKIPVSWDPGSVSTAEGAQIGPVSLDGTGDREVGLLANVGGDGGHEPHPYDSRNSLQADPCPL